MNIKNIARKSTTFSELMLGKTKIETEDIIKYYDKGITIREAEGVDMPDSRNEDGMAHFYIFTFEEEPDKFAFAGYVLTKIFDDILTECAGDIEQFNKELLRQGLKVKLSTSKTKNKREVTTVEVID